MEAPRCARVRKARNADRAADKITLGDDFLEGVGSLEWFDERAMEHEMTGKSTHGIPSSPAGGLEDLIPQGHASNLQYAWRAAENYRCALVMLMGGGSRTLGNLDLL